MLAYIQLKFYCVTSYPCQGLCGVWLELLLVVEQGRGVQVGAADLRGDLRGGGGPEGGGGRKFA